MEKDNLSFDVYRKPTTRDTIIPNYSCHPHEHKIATMRFLNKKWKIKFKYHKKRERIQYDQTSIT